MSLLADFLEVRLFLLSIHLEQQALIELHEGIGITDQEPLFFIFFLLVEQTLVEGHIIVHMN